jgi:hypothetical protein
MVIWKRFEISSLNYTMTKSTYILSEAELSAFIEYHFSIL